MKLFQRGFTLIEILIVMLIISIVAGIAVLSIGRSSYQTMNRFQSELVELLQFAQEEAILKSTVIMLAIEQDRLQFYRYQTDHETDENKWIPSDDKILNSKPIPKEIVIQVKTLSNQSDNEKEDEDEKEHTQIVFSSNGSVTPFQLYIGKQGEKPRYFITMSQDGDLTSKELS
jgi:general secretion pathway protein H